MAHLVSSLSIDTLNTLDYLQQQKYYKNEMA